MKDTVKIGKYGSSLGFVIPSHFLEASNLKFKDPINLSITKIWRDENQEESVDIPMNRPIGKVGNSLGIIIKKPIAKRFKLEKGMLIVIEIPPQS